MDAGFCGSFLVACLMEIFNTSHLVFSCHTDAYRLGG